MQLNLKAKGIFIFSVGLGNIDQEFLLNISSGEDYVYHTPDSSELQALFHKIASNDQIAIGVLILFFYLKTALLFHLARRFLFFRIVPSGFS